MSWLNRGPHRYYIRKARDRGRLISVYVGRGPAADAVAAADAERAAARRQAIARHAQQIALAGEIDAAAALVADLVEALADASLLAAGHHFDDHREWKRLRGK